MAQRLGENAHCSPLLRKARRHGLDRAAQFIQMAANRGCRHYAGIVDEAVVDPGTSVISNEELVALLLLGEQEFEPVAVRCAAQLLSSCDPERLARLAERERIGRTLAYIARAGLANDREGTSHWRRLLRLLGEVPPVAGGRLPHWSRFVLQTGITRHGPGSVRWLHPNP